VDVLKGLIAFGLSRRLLERRRLAYRTIGTGKPIVLCTRFRGNMDVWDPAFLDALATNGFRVITFDYSGLGLSTGEKSYDPVSLARDAKELIEALGLNDAVISGWSLGGLGLRSQWQCSLIVSVTPC
jgi:pimeloyl-ACP methyl ester carboxylesterase